MKSEYDIAIIGSGFGGSLLAMVARRLGLSVLLLEKGRHPRFAIGESTSPLANLLLEQLALRYNLPRLLPLTSYGPWQRSYPSLGCGLKRGFSYLHHATGQSDTPPLGRSRQLLVAASPNDELADTHWLRSDVDEFLVAEAIAVGVDYWDGVSLTSADLEGSLLLTGKRRGRPFTVQPRLVIDATGPHGFLARTLEIPETDFTDYPGTQSLYSHFTGVKRWGDTHPCQTTDVPPYSVDDAALHHVFDGGWMWVLRFGNGITSAGIAVTDALAQDLRLADGEAAWGRFLARFPHVREQFAEAVPVKPFTHSPRLAYRAGQAAGPGWAMLPSAAAFVDPLFSTGIPLTLLGIERMGRILERSWGQDTLNADLQEYGGQTLMEADATADFIGACYAAMPRFPLFAALSMFYFTAASFSEMARRLEKRHLVSRFLASDHPCFGPNLRACTDWVRRHAQTASEAEIAGFERHVAEAISCLNVAGLADPSKNNWYGVDLQDVVASAAKLGMTQAEMEEVLRVAPWAQPQSAGS